MDKVIHFEIPADDMERVKKFYSENFGWEMKDTGPDMGGYVVVHAAETDANNMVQDKGAINGGLMKRDSGAKGPILVISVDSMDESLEKIKNSGGKLVSEVLDIPTVGRYARIEDTEGNTIALLQPSR